MKKLVSLFLGLCGLVFAEPVPKFTMELIPNVGCVMTSMKDEMNLDFLNEKGTIEIKRINPTFSEYQVRYLYPKDKKLEYRTFFIDKDDCNAVWYNMLQKGAKNNGK